MLVYHVTNPKAADAIEREGFRDNTGRYLTEHLWTGVWVSDVPYADDYRIKDPVVFEIDTQADTLAKWEWVEERKHYREWLVPAAVLNRFARRRVPHSHNRQFADFDKVITRAFNG